ncbi:uncharacterized protein LTR77_009036 [Saxophila tyrrhenica]|uniref:Uncharacterized protein n=1 Tax=Saxophila tyrrhenica TaxID=1690608 RepID=A0AAV9P072_9PEZI|nr:hypothetical protein LTR77_009036 [Saxophila tyrrhenica]
MEGHTDKQERRKGGLRRVIAKLKGAFGRRGGKVNAAGSNEGAASQQREEPVAREGGFSEAPVGNTSSPAENVVEDTLISIPPASSNAVLVAEHDNTMSVPEDEKKTESAPPARQNRSGMAAEKAQALFEKYGVTYDPSTAPAVSETKARRVEKPIRIRIHWTCHDCNSQFGGSKTCANCGHRRCGECPRAPAKKIREALENAQNAAREQNGGAGPGMGGMTTALVVEASEAASPALAAERTLSGNIEARTPEDMAADDLPAELSLYVKQQRPSTGVEAVFESQDRTTRRTCHECETHFEPGHADECQHCGHKLCTACPRDPIRRNQSTRDGTDDQERSRKVQKTSTVQRVFRKPRQRIRWTCHECDLTFVDKQKCRGCGHERCRQCPRTPSKKVPPPPDPAVLQSLADKLGGTKVCAEDSEVEATTAE